MSSKPKLLILTPVLPQIAAGGSSIRIQKIMECLAPEFEIECVGVVGARDAAKVEEKIPVHLRSMIRVYPWKEASPSERFKNMVRGALTAFPFNFSEPFCREFAGSLRQGAMPRVILVEKCIMAALMLRSGLTDHFKSVPKVLDEGALHYIPYERDARHERNWVRKIVHAVRALRLKIFSRRIVGHFQKVLVVSADEAHELSGFYPPEKICLVPNGNDTEARGTVPLTADLAFFGPYNYGPNLHALRWFLEKVFPQMDRMGFNRKIYIAGAHPPKFATDLAQSDPRLIVTGYVAEVREIYDKAGIILCPMWLGAGTRTKVLEAMAYGKAIVATTVSCEGIDVRDGQEALIRDDPKKFAAAVMELTVSPERVQKLGEMAEKCIRGNYRWTHVLAGLPQALKFLSEGSL